MSGLTPRKPRRSGPRHSGVPHYVRQSALSPASMTSVAGTFGGGSTLDLGGSHQELNVQQSVVHKIVGRWTAGGNSARANPEAERLHQLSLETLPVAALRVRLRRGEDPEEYGSLATKPWDVQAARNNSPMLAPSTVQSMQELLQEEKDAARNAEQVSNLMKHPLVEEVSSVATALEGEMLRAMGSVCKQGVVATSKGVVVPYQWYERVTGAMFNSIEGLSASCVSELGKSTPTVATQPELFRSKTEVRTAVCAATLWRMLEQVKGSIPGMGVALALFKELLGTVYESFEEVEPLLPNVANLSEQIVQLCGIPLHCCQRFEANNDAGRLGQDVQYLRKAMQNWSFQHWKGYKLAERRREHFLIRLESLVSSQERRKMKKIFFTSWRSYVRQRKVTDAFTKFKNELSQILEEPDTANKAKWVLHIPTAAERDEENRRQMLDSVRGKPPPQTGMADILKWKVELPTATAIDPSDPKQQQPQSNKRPVRDLPVVAEDEMIPFFSLVAEKSQMLKEINETLRVQSTMLTKRLGKLENEGAELRGTVKQHEQKVLTLLHEKVNLKNEIQALQVELDNQKEHAMRLLSKIRGHHHSKWRRAAMSILADVSGIEAPLVKSLERMRYLSVSTEANKDGPVTPREKGVEEDLDGSADTNEGNDGNIVSFSEFGHDGTSSEGSSDDGREDMEEAERTFREKLSLAYAPSVTCLPNARQILCDWGNHCLDDLATIDRSAGASAGNLRFSDLSSEIRDGMILSRLMFFLALPRYKYSNTRIANLRDASDDFRENRLRVLRGDDVSFHPPFPTYMNCFGDLQRIPFSRRHDIILEFAAELLHSRQRMRFGDQRAADATSVEENAFLRGDVTDPFSLAGVVSSVELADGASGAAITLLALMYVKFAHTFNHKANSEIEEEKEKLITLYTESINGSDAAALADIQESVSIVFPQLCANRTDMLESLTPLTPATPFCDISNAATLINEEKTPWQLFLERCYPLVSSSSHAYVLEGNFWPLDVVESTPILSLFSKMVLSLNKSLEIHKLHVILSCLARTQLAFGHSRRVFAVQSPKDILSSYVAFLKESHADVVSRDFVAKLLLERKEECPVEDILDTLTIHLFDIADVFFSHSVTRGDSDTLVMPLSSFRILMGETGLFPTLLTSESITRIYHECNAAVAAAGKAGHILKRRVSIASDSDSSRKSLEPADSAHELSFSEFVHAVVMLGHCSAPPLELGTEGSPSTGSLAMLPAAISRIVDQYFATTKFTTPLQTVERLMSGGAEEVLRKKNAELHAAFNVYAKGRGSGVACIDIQDFMKMSKDIGLITHEFSLSVVQDIFHKCSLLKISQSSSGSISDKPALIFETFAAAVCVMTVYKFPSPFVQFSVRLQSFIARFFVEALQAKVLHLRSPPTSPSDTKLNPPGFGFAGRKPF